MLASNDATISDPKALGQLVRVHQLRTDAAERELINRQKALEAERQAQRQREQALRDAEQTLLDFRHYLVNEGAKHIASLGETLTHYRESLEHSINKCNLELERGKNLVKAAEKAAEEAAAAWRRAVGRRDAVADAHKRSKAAVALDELNKIEDEVDDRGKAGRASNRA